MKFKFSKKIVIAFLILSICALAAPFLLSYHIQNTTKNYIFENSKELPQAYTVIVLGASVKRDGELSTILKDRVESALFLYNTGKVKRFLLSGDNGSTSYNEPQAMKKYLLERGVPEQDIFLDYAGFDTYDSIYRASYIFEVNKAIVVTQRFHLPRAIYIARSKDLDFYGYTGDRRRYSSAKKNKLRELVANLKAWGELLINKDPHFKGSRIPITGKNNS